jgi:2,4-dienoyl-CoA reductase (NADPH2)
LDEINRCIACNQGCFDPIFDQKPVTCLVNARAGAEGKRTIEPATRKKKVMVIGGGPAGMEAARVAAFRGHRVSLYEKAEKLGGQLLLAAAPPGRGEFLSFVSYLETQMKVQNVAVHTRTEVTPEYVELEKPDVVVVATVSPAGQIPVKKWWSSAAGPSGWERRSSWPGKEPSTAIPSAFSWPTGLRLLRP